MEYPETKFNDLVIKYNYSNYNNKDNHNEICVLFKDLLTDDEINMCIQIRPFHNMPNYNEGKIINSETIIEQFLSYNYKQFCSSMVYLNFILPYLKVACDNDNNYYNNMLSYYMPAIRDFVAECENIYFENDEHQFNWKNDYAIFTELFEKFVGYKKLYDVFRFNIMKYLSEHEEALKIFDEPINNKQPYKVLCDCINCIFTYIKNSGTQYKTLYECLNSEDDNGSSLLNTTLEHCYTYSSSKTGINPNYNREQYYTASDNACYIDNYNGIYSLYKREIDNYNNFTVDIYTFVENYPHVIIYVYNNKISSDHHTNVTEKLNNIRLQYSTIMTYFVTYNYSLYGGYYTDEHENVIYVPGSISFGASGYVIQKTLPYELTVEYIYTKLSPSSSLTLARCYREIIICKYNKYNESYSKYKNKPIPNKPKFEEPVFYGGEIKIFNNIWIFIILIIIIVIIIVIIIINKKNK